MAAQTDRVERTRFHVCELSWLTCELHIFHFPLLEPKHFFPSFCGLQQRACV